MTNSLNNNPGCLTAILQALGIQKKEQPKDQLPYKTKEELLTPAELSFYRVLSSITGKKTTIFPKIRLADIFSVSSKEDYFSHFNKISQKHVDFLLCQSETLRPILGIELDDSSHQRKSRQERDEFINKAFNAAGLPLVRIPVQRTYTTRDIAAQLGRYLPDITNAREDKESSLQEPKQPNEDIPSRAIPIPKCPTCGSPMVIRTVTKGDHQGKQFYGCTTFPKCRGVLPISENVG